MEKEYMTPIIAVWILFPLTFFCVLVLFTVFFFSGKNIEIFSTPTAIEKDVDTISNFNTYSIIVDKDTGIVYLVNDNSMTAMFDAEGKPILAQDLGLE